MVSERVRDFNPKSVPIPAGDFDFVKDLKFPIVVEIGCGTGMHSLCYAQENLEQEIVAIERTKEKYRKFFNSYLQQGQPKNIYPVQADAILWLSHFIKERQVKKYFLLYPNPYPKKKHKNLRFVNMPFFSFLLKTLVHGGEIVLATNVFSYYTEAKEKILSHWGMTLIEDKLIPKNSRPRTLFEKKYLERGELCYNLVFKKL